LLFDRQIGARVIFILRHVPAFLRCA
jgi:hypothetical protein